MPQGEEEGPERDVVEPTGEQTEMGLKVQLVQCRGKALIRRETHKSKPRKRLWLKKKETWSWERPGCLITSIYSHLGQN